METEKSYYSYYKEELDKINKPGSGWFPEELESLSVVPNKNWILK